MKNVFIIADDTTGANSSAILHKKLGYDCVSIHTKALEIRKQSVYAFSTNSRGISSEEAYSKVHSLLEEIKVEDAIYNKRVDSTLRGNLGSELDAFLDVFPNKKAIVVASFPDSYRTCHNDTLYVDQVKLEDTDVAKDPKMPVTSSTVTTLFKKQSNRVITHINLDIVRSESFKNELLDYYQHSDIIVIDAVINNDIKRIADMCVKEKLDIICVDPGPFTYYYARAMKEQAQFRFHCLIGSVTPLTIKQMKYAVEHGAYLYQIDVKKLLSDQYKPYMSLILFELKRIKNDFIIITTSSIDCDSKVDLSDFIKDDECIEDISNTINQRIAKIFIEFNQETNPHCVYTSGGDTTVEFLSQAGSYGLRMNSQIIPLTVESQVLGGALEGLHIVSKGGLIGEEKTIMDIYHYMKVGK